MTPDQIILITDRKTRVREVQILRQQIETTSPRPSNLYRTISDQTGLTYNQVAADLRDARRWYGPLYSQSSFQPVDHRRVALQAYLGTTFRTPPFAYSRHTTRVIVGVGDLHGDPDPAIVADLVKAQADIYVVAGDTLDNQIASAHVPESKEELLRRRSKAKREEFANLRTMFEVLITETEGNIKVFDGNHDQWVTRRLIELLPDYLLDYFTDPLDMLVEGLSPRVERVIHTQCFHYPNGSSATYVPETRFMYMLGDVLFSHKNFTGKHPGQGALRLFDWFSEWKLPLGLEHIHILIQYHGHKRAMLNRSGGWYTLIEPGMGGTTTTEEYKFGYQAKWQPSVQGFVRLEQYQDANSDWHTDNASIGMIAPRLSGHVKQAI